MQVWSVNSNVFWCLNKILRNMIVSILIVICVLAPKSLTLSITQPDAKRCTIVNENTVSYFIIFALQWTNASSLWTHWYEFQPDQILRLLQQWPPWTHLDTVTYHNWFWIHICPSCHTKSRTWAFFFSQDYEANIFFILVKRNKIKVYSCVKSKDILIDRNPPVGLQNLVPLNQWFFRSFHRILISTAPPQPSCVPPGRNGLSRVLPVAVEPQGQRARTRAGTRQFRTQLSHFRH